MRVAAGKSRTRRLAELAAIIDSHADWWRFPAEKPVRGFLGTRRLFIVGDQPSTSSWDSWNPNRRAFYDLLARIGAADAHLTVLYKVRGRSGALKADLPPDFGVHLKLFRQELDILKPTRVVALGRHACGLLAEHAPEVRSILGWMWHFAYAVRYGRIAAWEANARAAIDGTSASAPGRPSESAVVLVAPLTVGVSRNLTRPERPRTRRAVMQNLFIQNPAHRGGQKGPEMGTTEPASGLVETLNEVPAGLPYREWTIRDDNKHHYHNQVRLSESPLLIKLQWRATARDRVREVGCFRLNLPGLLARRLIREELSSRARGDVRVRFVCESGRVYLQVRDGEPRLLIGKTGGA